MPPLQSKSSMVAALRATSLSFSNQVSEAWSITNQEMFERNFRTRRSTKKEDYGTTGFRSVLPLWSQRSLGKRVQEEQIRETKDEKKQLV